MARIPTLHSQTWATLPGYIDVKQYGAKGNGSTDDRTAINNAIAAAATFSGTVFFPPGSYRVTNFITSNPAVSLVGVPSKSLICIDHPTNNTLTCTTGPQDNNYMHIKDLNFEGLQANSGRVIDNNSGQVYLNIDNCVFNGGDGGPWNLNGNLIWALGPSHVSVNNCHMRANGNANLIVVSNDAAVTHITNNNLYMPPTFSTSMVRLSRGTSFVQGNYFDVTAHNNGSGASCIAVDAFAPLPQTITGNNFFTTGGPTTYAVSTSAGSWVIGHGNSFGGGITRLSSNFLASGSTFDLFDADYGIFGGTTGTVSNGVSNMSMSFSSTAPTITMPTMYFPGQEINISIRNASAGSWSGIGVNGLNGPLISTTISGGQAVTFKAKVMSLRANNTWVWSMVGQYSIGFTTT